MKSRKQVRKQASGTQNTQTNSRPLQKKTAATIVKVLLLIFLIASLACIAGEEYHRGHWNRRVADSRSPETAGETATGKTVAKPPANEPAAKEPGTVIAYYFRGSTRCYSCVTIENYAREAIEAGFSDALKDGRLQWKVVNVEEPGNEHFIQDYQLYSQSVVLVEIKDGKQTKWKNLAEVWPLLNDKAAFQRYVQEEVGAFLGGSR
ncbi:MAG: nitrophenyl compound nitroreductase subunit ArsF family protein [Bacillota bacterium]